jgi:hypothetical protein
LELRGGGQNTEIGRVAYLKDLHFTEGAIECEVKSVQRNEREHNYLGLIFRVLDEKRYDLVYLRWRNDAAFKNRELQYVPVTDGIDRWRDFSGKYFASHDGLMDGEWIKMRLEVKGNSLKVFLAGGSKPALTVDQLVGPGQSGSVGVWAFPTSGIGHFRNLKVTPAAAGSSIVAPSPAAEPAAAAKPRTNH